MANDWAHKMLDDIRPDFYGELTFTIQAGEIKRVAKVQTFLRPEAFTQKVGVPPQKIFVDKPKT